MIQDKLEIILITYNRKKCLEKTLQQLFAASSPVHKGISVTILDNCSTDGTSALITAYACKYPQIKHIRHSKNIGGNANIARLFELAEKPYVWPLCDDDELHLEYFQEVEQAISANADCIVVNTEYSNGSPKGGALFRLLTFLPSAIYKTSLITPTVLMNIYNNVPNWFPHLAVTAEVLNNQGKIIITEHNLVRRDEDKSRYTFNTKKENTWDGKSLPAVNRFLRGLPPSAARKNLFFAYCASCELLKDPALRGEALAAYELNYGFWKAVNLQLRENWKRMGGYLPHITAIYTNLPFFQKLLFLFVFLFHLILSPFYLISYRLFKKRENIQIS